MLVFPNCKINLGLNITSKREDGFHNLESVFYPINLCDTLELNVSARSSFNAYGIHIPGDSRNNLVLKAYDLLNSKFGLASLEINLLKKHSYGWRFRGWFI